MKTTDYFALYSYMNPAISQTGSEENSQASSYYLLEVFSNRQLQDKEYLKNLYNDLLFESGDKDYPNLVGPFQDKNQLKHFCQEFLVKNKGTDIHIFSAKEFNLIIEKSDSLRSCEESMLNGGEIVENLDLKQRSSFFGRLFN